MEMDFLMEKGDVLVVDIKHTGTEQETIDYVTIASLRNAIDFGNLLCSQKCLSISIIFNQRFVDGWHRAPANPIDTMY